MILVSAFGFADVLGAKNVVLDLSRVASSRVGHGFLGAGSILLRGEIVLGLTTAVSLRSVAGIGLTVGGGMYTAAVGATVVIFIILAGVKPLERRFIAVKQERSITLLVERGAVSLDSVQNALGKGSVRVKQFIVQQSEDDPELDHVQIGLSRAATSEFETIRTRLAAMSGVRECRNGC